MKLPLIESSLLNWISDGYYHSCQAKKGFQPTNKSMVNYLNNAINSEELFTTESVKEILKTLEDQDLIFMYTAPNKKREIIVI